MRAIRLFKPFAALSLPKASSHNHRQLLHVRSFQSYKSHNVKFNFDDSQLLRCLSNRNLKDARYLLDKMVERDFDYPVVLWTSLLTKYSRAGYIDESKFLFDIMPERNIVTYNAMLSAFVQCRRLSEAIQIFGDMRERNVVSWTSMLSGLADAGRMCEARRLFDDMPQRNVVSWNSLVVGLIRNGDLEEARQMFDAMPERNVISGNAMISGYVEDCNMDEARLLFDGMEVKNVVTWTSMIAGYCRTGKIAEAYSFFQRMPEKNVVSWTAMIGGFTWNDFYADALSLFLKMKRNQNIKPNGETFVSLIYACAGMKFPFLGKQLHAQLIVSDMECGDYDGRLSRSLIHMYSSFGNMDFACYILNRNCHKCIVQSYNSMINGYIQIGKLEEAENLFDVMPVRDKVSWTSMVDGYFSVGKVSKGCYLFNKMPDKDSIAWTVIISGHVQNELFQEAISLFKEMCYHGFNPLNSTFSVLLGASGALADMDKGKQLHCMLMKTLNEKTDLIISNSLISMYAKCGVIEDAYKIFSSMVNRDLISWNSMIMGFSYHGLAKESLIVFDAMLESGALPNNVTFLGLLSACGHAGLVDRGWELFDSMRNVYGIEPGVEHYVSMINILGRAGKVKEAEEFVLRLPFEPDRTIWGALLGVCGIGERNNEVASMAAKSLLELDPMNAPAHVALCNMYAASGRRVEEENLREEMRIKDVKKKVPGFSWITLNGRSLLFLSGLEPSSLHRLFFLSEQSLPA
ncbi:pentatricopeptide repeat-containing protein At1g32415, mitochondrial [Rutidosis leptorrhynchoides]|uniref:pentatricopeptide repeat-containing protein At1g32415, mitochondrial n=1 Tax=Rutidosis leptorrhynchoides TaxID=125765 RepID=UPI003A99405A